jgi:C4-dicarboxylate-specific signal transduction histidine kinase
MELVNTASSILLFNALGTALYVVLVVMLGIMVFFWHRSRQETKEAIHFKEKMQKELSTCRSKLQKLEELEQMIPELKKIAKLDHDVNTPLCVITMSLGRAKKLGQQSSDESLLNNVKDITDAVARIGEIMQAVRVLKTHPLVVQNKAHTSTKEIGQ